MLGKIGRQKKNENLWKKKQHRIGRRLNLDENILWYAYNSWAANKLPNYTYLKRFTANAPISDSLHCECQRTPFLWILSSFYIHNKVIFEWNINFGILIPNGRICWNVKIFYWNSYCIYWSFMPNNDRHWK